MYTRVIKGLDKLPEKELEILISDQNTTNEERRNNAKYFRKYIEPLLLEIDRVDNKIKDKLGVNITAKTKLTREKLASITNAQMDPGRYFQLIIDNLPQNDLENLEVNEKIKNKLNLLDQILTAYFQEKHVDQQAKISVTINTIYNAIGVIYQEKENKKQEERENKKQVLRELLPFEKITSHVVNLNQVYIHHKRTKHIQDFEKLTDRIYSDVSSYQFAQPKFQIDNTKALILAIKPIEDEFRKYVNRYKNGFLGINKKDPNTFGAFLNKRKHDYNYPHLLGLALKDFYALNNLEPPADLKQILNELRNTRYNANDINLYRDAIGSKNTMELQPLATKPK